MVGMKQFFLLVLLLPILSHAVTKLSGNLSQEIISFALFNYDNLIADCYENEKPYITQLAKLLSEATSKNKSIYFKVLNSRELCNESVPTKYLLLLNKKTSEISKYIFLDE